MEDNRENKTEDLDKDSEEVFESLSYENNSKNTKLPTGQIKVQNSKKQLFRRRGK
jgi:hypothetical protein